jgi:hypothetical protein
MAEAWNLWDRVWADDRVIFLPEPEEIEREFRARSRCPVDLPRFGPTLIFWHLLRSRV